MTLGRLVLLGALFFSLGAAPAVAEDAPPPANKGHVAKSKANGKPKPDGMSLQEIQFSDPNAPPLGAAKPQRPAKPVQNSAARSVAAEPQGGAALDLKWRAEKHVNNPYWEPWVPNGQGESVEAGVKVGF